MPIPPLNEHGLLPPGIHECTIEEIGQRFGGRPLFRRRVLWTELNDYVERLREAEVGTSLLVVGSYVTSVEEPNDVDVLLELPSAICRAGCVPIGITWSLARVCRCGRR